MGISVGVVIGVIVLLVSIGFVVVMMVSEWSQPSVGQPLAENPAAEPEAAPARARAAAPRAKKKKTPAKVAGRPGRPRLTAASKAAPKAKKKAKK